MVTACYWTWGPRQRIFRRNPLRRIGPRRRIPKALHTGRNQHAGFIGAGCWCGRIGGSRSLGPVPGRRHRTGHPRLAGHYRTDHHPLARPPFWLAAHDRWRYRTITRSARVCPGFGWSLASALSALRHACCCWAGRSGIAVVASDSGGTLAMEIASILRLRHRKRVWALELDARERDR